jgi:hypothetical protein
MTAFSVRRPASVALSATVDAGGDVVAAPATAVEADFVANGGWTWYNDERAIAANGFTFVTYNAGGGNSGNQLAARYRHSDGQITTGTITTAGSLDDHVCPGLIRLPSGTLVAFYCQNPDTFVRYRFSTSADSVTAWGAVQTTPNTPFNTVYVNPRYLPTSGRVILFSRCIIDSSTRRHYFNVSADNAATWGSWVEYMRPASNGIPYLIAEQTGDRIYLLMSDTHPVSGQSSIYCGYCEWVSGELRFYDMAGTQLTLPFNTTSLTLVYSGSSVRSWNWDIKIDGDGRPRILFSRYPNNNGTDIRMMFTRWDGSAFTTPVDIRGSSVGTSLYAGEAFYTGGACFDGNDLNAVYLSAEVATGVYEMQKWRTSDNGATWAKVRDLSTGTSGQDNIRPVSPPGHSANDAVYWMQTTYTAYDNWSGKLRFANEVG